ncbi:SIS domain-containing protein [Nonomuraea insulae]|uniref:Glutamine--fructose-6-phosphate aminotransferase [isomerizing] n=1 Tax=Nonomuraea insulae TaxID=1616787 RepID=A0ABW1D3X0_9ACTN
MPRIPYAQGRATQPKALERVVRRVHDQLATADGGGASSRPAFVGVGASYAALALPMEILCAAGVPARRELASELRATDADLLLGVSQSGRSPETIDALGLVPRSRRTALVNVTPSLLGESVDRLVDLGNEDDSYASTIGYTGTQVALAMIARTMLGWTADEAAAEWAGIAATLAAFEAAVAGPVDEVAALARTVVAADFVASGAARSATESGALLLREVCRVPAAALVTRNYLHGEMESAGATLHVIVGDDRELELARSLARAGHLTLCVTSALLDPEDSLHVVTVPGDLPLPVRAVLQTAVAQRLAGSLALARGVDIEEFVFHNSDTKLGEPVG